MSLEKTINKIDAMIRVLSNSTPKGGLLDSNDIEAIKSIEKDDQPKLVERLEDLIILLKDEPDNKRRIREMKDHTMDGFGNVQPVREALEDVEKFFLGGK